MPANLKFEQGPIRPPNEARSLLLRTTRNCPWNQCRFCPVYKRRKFSLRTVEEIKADIQTARDMADDIQALSVKLGYGGRVTEEVAGHVLNTPGYSTSYRGMALWRYYGTEACFLQDADNLIMKTADLVAVLDFLRQKFPEIRRVTTYSRSRSVVRKSVADLSRLRQAGLNRIHIGLESGHDPVLKFMKKGVTAAQHIEAGQKILTADMELSEYVMPGLGGRKMWRGHALDTARVLNAINPHFIRLRSLRVPPRVPLHAQVEDGSFSLPDDDMVVEEIRLFIETLNGITSTVTSDHMMNLLEEVSGKLPQDKARMLAVIEKYQNLSDRDRLIYRAGRRSGVYAGTDDLKADLKTYEKLAGMVADIEAQKGAAGVEKFIDELVDRYV